MGAEDNFWGVIDLVTMTAWDFKADEKGMTYPEPMDAIPAEFADEAELHRQELLEAAADCDDELMEKVPHGGGVVRRGAQGRSSARASSPAKIHPVFVGSVLQEQGRAGAAGRRGRLPARPRWTSRPSRAPTPTPAPTTSVTSDVKAPFSALAFKIMTDPFVGKLTYLRVYSGQLESGSYVLNATKDKKERVGRLLQMHSNQRVDIDGCAAGDIVAVRRPEGHHHGRHPVRRGHPDRPRVHGVR